MDNRIKTIYIGLPEHLQQRVYRVERMFRKNELSHTPGGSDVVVEYHSGKVFLYDWIKYPSEYIMTIFSDNFFEDETAFRLCDRECQLEIARREISTIHARKYSAEHRNETPFKKAWDFRAEVLPWEALIDFNYSGDVGVGFDGGVSS